MSDRSTTPANSSVKTPSFADTLNAFLHNHRRLLLILGAAIVVLIIAAVAASQILSARADASVAAAERIQERWQAYQDADRAAGDEEAQSAPTEAEADLRAAIDEAISDFPNGYAALRARYTLGQLEWQLENWEAALEAFVGIADEHRTSYLTAPALLNAAAAAENLGNTDRARELYGRLVDGDISPNAEIAHALFNLGRLAEEAGDRDLALEYYNRLVDEHGGSNWTNLGRNRIIWLQSQGAGADG